MKTKFLIILIILIGLGAGGVFVYRNIFAPKIGFEWFQTGNTLSITQLQPKQSRELEDNRIGQMASLEADIRTEQDADDFVDQNSNLGLKWVRLSIDYFDWTEVVDEGTYSEYHIDPNQDRAITGLVNNDIKIMYTLVYWDPEAPSFKEEEKQDYSRFKAEDEIQRYLDYVQFIVHNFKDRIEYYEILNEPNHVEGTQQHVELDDYINLVKRTVPVIRQEYPEAKIVVGAHANLREFGTEYLFGILNSDVMPLVDAVSFHPMYGVSPEYDYYREYYYNYPSLIQEIKNRASAHGFKGEYIADELIWRTPVSSNPDEPWIYSKTASAKYYARGIIINLGMNLTTGLALENLEELPLMVGVIRNLSTIMAGAKPTELPIEIQSEVANIKIYSFSLSNGDKLVVLWTDGVAVDEDPGIKADLTFDGLNGKEIIGIDVLNGYQQSIIISGNKIQNLIVRDYPLILHIKK